MVRRHAGRQREQPDLGGGVEAEPEQHARAGTSASWRRSDARQPADEEAVHEARGRAGAARAAPRRTRRGASRRKMRTMSSSTSRLRMPMIHRNVPETRRADVAAVVLERRDLRVDASLAAIARPRGEQEHDRRVAEREEEADAERPLARPGATFAWCCRSPRCGRRRRRGAARTCRRACRARRARGCRGRRTGTGPSRRRAAPRSPRRTSPAASIPSETPPPSTSRRPSCCVALLARAAEPEYREVGEPRAVAETAHDLAAHRLDLVARHLEHVPAALAREVLAVAAGRDRVAAGAVAAVDVADEPDGLQRLEVAVDDGRVERRRLRLQQRRQPVDGDQRAGGEQTL